MQSQPQTEPAGTHSPNRPGLTRGVLVVMAGTSVVMAGTSA
jgi:hypothetical protein